VKVIQFSFYVDRLEMFLTHLKWLFKKTSEAYDDRGLLFIGFKNVNLNFTDYLNLTFVVFSKDISFLQDLDDECFEHSISKIAAGPGVQEIMNNKVENYTETQLVECLLNHAIMQTSFVELRDLKPSTPTFKLLRRFYQERKQKNSYGEKGPNLKKESGDQMEQKYQNH
jgi:ABC-type oligopeptide transport system ATPase subunit